MLGGSSPVCVVFPPLLAQPRHRLSDENRSDVADFLLLSRIGLRGPDYLCGIGPRFRGGPKSLASVFLRV